MNVSLNNISFKGYTPVRLFVKDSQNGIYYPVAKPSKAKKINGHLVRNLNQTLKKPNTNFINYYASYDKDYAKKPYIHSIYDIDSPTVILASGDDGYQLDKMGKAVGEAKGQSKKMFGHSKSREAKDAAREYFRNAKNFLRTSSSPVKDKKGNPVILNAYFETKYNKKGEIKEYKLNGVEFTNEIDNLPKKNPNLSMIPQDADYKQKSIFDLLDE